MWAPRCATLLLFFFNLFLEHGEPQLPWQTWEQFPRGRGDCFVGIVLPPPHPAKHNSVSEKPSWLDCWNEPSRAPSSTHWRTDPSVRHNGGILNVPTSGGIMIHKRLITCYQHPAPIQFLQCSSHCVQRGEACVWPVKLMASGQLWHEQLFTFGLKPHSWKSQFPLHNFPWSNLLLWRLSYVCVHYTCVCEKEMLAHRRVLGLFIYLYILCIYLN